MCVAPALLYDAVRHHVVQLAVDEGTERMASPCASRHCPVVPPPILKQALNSLAAPAHLSLTQ